MENSAVSSYLNDPTLQELSRIRESQFAQAAAMNSGRIQQAEAYRAQGMQDLKQQFASIPKEDQASVAAIHDLEAFKKKVNMQADMAAIDPNSKSADFELKRIKERYGDVKDFIDTEEYKKQQEHLYSLKDDFKIVSTLGNQVDTMQKLYNSGNIDDATAYAKTALIKTMNSLISKDSVQLGEALVRYQDIMTASDIAQLKGDGPFNPKVVANKIMSLPPSEKKGMIDRVTNALENAYNIDPAKFIQKARNMHDDSAITYNDSLSQIARASSNSHLKRMGGRALPLFRDLDAAEAAAQQSQAIQGGAPTMAPTAAPAPVQAPVQMGPAPAATIAPTQNRPYTPSIWKRVN